MKNFIVIFREPDGRIEQHSQEAIERHQRSWKRWFEKWKPEGRINGGSGLTLSGALIDTNGEMTADIHRVGTEIIGGFLLIKADTLEDATEMMKSCPIFEFGGYAEIREIQPSS